MSSNRLNELINLGQSPWYDNIERRLIENGELASMIADGEIRGITSNPSIFNNSIANSKDYDTALVTMAWAGYSSGQIYDRLVLEDIRSAADLFLPLYEQTNGGDGYVSLEVSPSLARDTYGTINEAQRLWQAVSRPNLMIKIPATPEGIPAIRATIASGINVNVTLIFSLTRYQEVMEAYLTGLQDRLDAGKPIDQIASVASFFVSRIDSKIDKLLDALSQKDPGLIMSTTNLRGKFAIASARRAYQLFRKVFSGERFTHLEALGARIQRPLWASTSTKDPAYADTIYVDELIGSDTINTMPPQTLNAFRDHGNLGIRIDRQLDQTDRYFSQLAELNVSIERITNELELEGVKAFAEAYDSLMKTIEARRGKAIADLGNLAGIVAKRTTTIEAADLLSRLHAHDPGLWIQDPAGQEEIRNRLGWLKLPESSYSLVLELHSLFSQVKQAGFTHTLLLGMGGSSLAPEVFNLVFADVVRENGLKFAILDSTDPVQVWATVRRFPVKRTLFIVSSKSGGTAEVNAFLEMFWERARRILGQRVGNNFIAITDPGTSLERLAKQRCFRAVYSGEPTVGGRFSALSIFGLLPATLIGINIEQLLRRAKWMAEQCAADVPAGRCPGLVLGVIIGEAALSGRDKLTLIADSSLSSMGAWLEQLIAESSGKSGKGIIPIDQEPVGRPEVYGNDRLFVYLRREGKYDSAVYKLHKAGQPVLSFQVDRAEDLAAEIYRWEVAIAVACMILSVNAFDQPDVQDNKIRTLNKIAEYHQNGSLDQGNPIWQNLSMSLYSRSRSGIPDTVKNLTEAISFFLDQAEDGDYVGINAYLPRNRRMESLLRELRILIRKRTGLATTVGFGPRFLHSTGQLHKGGPDSGMFLQITVNPEVNLPIPGQGMSFGTLELAQALGDLESLEARKRRVLRVHLNSLSELKNLIRAVES